MKNLLYLFLAIGLIGCTPNCDEEREQLQQQYANAIANTGGSITAYNQVKADYENRLARLDERCE